MCAIRLVKPDFDGRWLLVATLLLCAGCKRQQHYDLDYNYPVEQTWQVNDLPGEEFVQFESVFWEPDDTTSLRSLIAEDMICDGRDVLEIGTGTGLIAVLSGRFGAKSVVATDINPAAVANARYNAALIAEHAKISIRQVNADRPGAFEVIKPKEKFDLIISNPPWEDGSISKPADHAYYDPSFALMDSLLDGLPRHLRFGGRCLLAYGHVPAIVRLREQAKERGLEFKILDDRQLEDLERDFLPGMLIEIRLPKTTNQTRPVPNQPDQEQDLETEPL